MTAEPLSPRRQLIKQNSEHDLYSQFDQLANSRQVKHDESNSIRRRERIKSFIDFDDDGKSINQSIIWLICFFQCLFVQVITVIFCCCSSCVPKC